MTTPEKNDPSRRLVRHALVNIFFFPGLGSVRAGRWAAGTAQIVIFLAGSVLLLVWFYKILSQYYGQMFDSVPVKSVGWIGILAGILLVISWAWSVVTAISLFNEASKQKQAPPVLAKKPPLNPPESKFAKELPSVPQWRLAGQVISRTYEFEDFVAAMKFVNAVAALAEQVQHHPDVDIRWNKVTLALTTHDAGGLTQKDFALAQQCDRLA